MSILILDTNIVSYIMDDRPQAELYRPRLEGNILAISFMTVAELYEGAFRAKWKKKRLRRLRRAIENYAVFASSAEQAEQWGRIRFNRRRQPISAQDAWIAAAALTYRCPLVTHNPADFPDIPGLRIVTAGE